jgi:hypothetical protein
LDPDIVGANPTEGAILILKIMQDEGEPLTVEEVEMLFPGAVAVLSAEAKEAHRKYTADGGYLRPWQELIKDGFFIDDKNTLHYYNRVWDPETQTWSMPGLIRRIPPDSNSPVA